MADYATTVAFSHHSRAFAVGYRDGTVRLWDWKTSRLLYEFTDLRSNARWGYGTHVEFSADDHWLACMILAQRSLVLYDLKSKNPRAVTFTKAHPGGVWATAFTADNRSLVTSGNDGLIRFWNLATLSTALTLEHGFGPGVFIALSPAEELLVSQDAHGVVKLWPAVHPVRHAKSKLQGRSGRIDPTEPPH